MIAFVHKPNQIILPMIAIQVLIEISPPTIRMVSIETPPKITIPAKRSIWMMNLIRDGIGLKRSTVAIIERIVIAHR